MPPDLEAYYEGEYHRLPRSAEELAALAEAERFKLDIVKEYAPGSRLLELGPSFGAFASLARKAGFDVDVVEPDRACQDVLARLVGVRVFDRLDVPELAAKDRYDVIALWQVFEHLPDAGRTLLRLRDMLRPGGVLVIATPNPDSPQARLFGRRWAHVDAPRHSLLAPYESLRRRAEGMGLAAESMTMTDAGSVGWNSFGWSRSLANLTIWPPLSVSLGLIGRAVALALRPIERTGRRGASYTAVFRKPS